MTSGCLLLPYRTRCPLDRFSRCAPDLQAGTLEAGHRFCHILARAPHQLLASGTASCLGAEGGSGPCHCHGSHRHDPPWQDPGRRGSQRRACTQGQPALLYLIPCTLGTLWVLAWHRGESALLWRRDVAAEALEHARKSHAPDRPDEEAGALTLPTLEHCSPSPGAESDVVAVSVHQALLMPVEKKEAGTPLRPVLAGEAL